MMRDTGQVLPQKCRDKYLAIIRWNAPQAYRASFCPATFSLWMYSS